MKEDTSAALIKYSTLTIWGLSFITWFVFLILKLCNPENPTFEWLTWFWVWFPFWLPWAMYTGMFTVAAIILVFLGKFFE